MSLIWKHSSSLTSMSSVKKGGKKARAWFGLGFQCIGLEGQRFLRSLLNWSKCSPVLVCLPGDKCPPGFAACFTWGAKVRWKALFTTWAPSCSPYPEQHRALLWSARRSSPGLPCVENASGASVYKHSKHYRQREERPATPLLAAACPGWGPRTSSLILCCTFHLSIYINMGSLHGVLQS